MHQISLHQRLLHFGFIVAVNLPDFRVLVLALDAPVENEHRGVLKNHQSVADMVCLVENFIIFKFELICHQYAPQKGAKKRSY